MAFFSLLRDRFQIGRWLTRQCWLDIHLFSALIVGFIFAILGVTGSLSVYREEIDVLLNPQLTVEKPQGDYQSLDRIIDAVRKAHPDRYGEWTLEMPASPTGMITVWFDKPRETFFERYAPLMVSVNPYTAEVVDSRFWGRTLTTWLLDWHTHLQWDEWGWEIVGCSAVLLIISILSGLYLWWPGVRFIVTALQIRIASGLVRCLFDLHRLIGLIGSGSLLILAFTGFQLSFPSLLENVFGSTGMAHGETGPSLISTAKPNDHPTVLEAAEFIARAPFHSAELRRVTTPAGDSGIYRVNLRQKGEVNRRHPYTTVWVDRWSGQIREVRDPKSFSAGQTFVTWMWPLHTGEALGPIGRFCWFLSGQVLFFLYVSGLVRWLHKKGRFKDRPLPSFHSTGILKVIKKRAFQTLLIIDRGMNLLARKGIPLAARKLIDLFEWVEKGVIVYRSKFKK